MTGLIRGIASESGFERVAALGVQLAYSYSIFSGVYMQTSGRSAARSSAPLPVPLWVDLQRDNSHPL